MLHCSRPMYVMQLLHYVKDTDLSCLLLITLHFIVELDENYFLCRKIVVIPCFLVGLEVAVLKCNPTIYLMETLGINSSN